MSLVLDFTAKLSEIVEVESLARAREALDSIGPPSLNGAPRAAVRYLAPGTERPPRKKPPRQLCPVPGCTNTAAPIFGMVCSKHKDIPKAKIKKYREQRKKAAERAAKDFVKMGAKAVGKRKRTARAKPATAATAEG